MLVRPLTKSGKPAILAANETTWTAEYLNDKTEGNKRRRWAHADIVAALKSETSGKCMYCEDLAEAVTWLHVEHILPKAKFEALVVDWVNLGFACPKCNVAKSDYHDPAAPLLNPFAEDPRTHLEFCGGLIRAKDGSMKGFMSIAKMDLARTALCQERMDQIEHVESLIRIWHLMPPGSVRDVVKAQIWDLSSESSKFSAAIGDHLRHVAFPR